MPITFTDDFESGLGAWTATGTPVTSTDQSVSPTHSLLVDTTGGGAAYLEKSDLGGLAVDDVWYYLTLDLYLISWADLDSTGFDPWLLDWFSFGGPGGLYIQSQSGSTGTIEYNLGGGSYIDSPLVPDGGWSNIKVGVRSNSGGGGTDIQFWIDGVTDSVVHNIPGHLPVRNITLGDDGSLGGGYPATDVYYVDNFEYESTANVPVTGAATPGSRSALLEGTVNPGGVATSYRFQYGTTGAYGTNTPWISVGSGSIDVAVARYIVSLAPSTLYHYRIQAQNTFGTFSGDDATFTTFAPFAPTNDDIANAQVLAGDSGCVQGDNDDATLETGEADLLYNPGGSTTVDYGGGRSVWYEWTADFDGCISFWTIDPNGNVSFDPPLSDTIVSVVDGTDFATATLLAQNEYADCRDSYSDATFEVENGATYWIAVDGYNGLPPNDGGYDVNDTQEGPFRLCWGIPVGCLVDATTGAASSITDVSAEIAGIVNPDCLPGEYFVKYGLTTGYGSQSAHGSIGAGNTPTAITRSLAGLSPNTLYHYRVCIATAYATDCGLDATFTTTLGQFGLCPTLLSDFTGDDCTRPGFTTVQGDGIRFEGDEGAVLHTEDPVSASVFGGTGPLGTVDLYETLAVVSGQQDLGWVDGGGNGYVVRSDADAGTTTIQQLDSYVATELASVAVAFADGDKLGFRFDAGTISGWQYVGTGPWVELLSVADATYTSGFPYVAMSNVPFDTAIDTAILFDLSSYGTMGGGDKYSWSQSRWRIFNLSLGANAYPNPAAPCPVWAAQLTVFPHGVFDYDNDTWSKGGGAPGGGDIFATEVWPYEPFSGATWDPTFDCFDSLQSFFVADADFTYKCYAAINTSMANILASFGTSFSGDIPLGFTFVDDCANSVDATDATQVFMPVVVDDGRIDDLNMSNGHCAPGIVSFSSVGGLTYRRTPVGARG